MDMMVLLFLVVACLFLLLGLGLPIAFTMAGLAVILTIYVWGWAGLYVVVSTTFGTATSFVYIAIPLFLLMANFLQSSGLADDMYEVIYRWTGRLRGGLAVGTVIICAIFAAMAGVSSVATVTMGTIALPSMRKRGYNESLVLGTIMAGGALGILIPPSVIMIIYGGVAEVSIGKLFMGGVGPGILLMIIYILYILIRCWMNPAMGPPCEERFSFKEKLVILKGLILPILLVLLVLGSIYTGVTTPTEAAGVGAFGGLICMALYGRLNYATIRDATLSTVNTTAMIMWIVIGAACFAHALAVAGIQDRIQEYFLALNVGRWWVIIFMQFSFFVLGMFLNPTAIVTMLGPIYVPIIISLGFDPLWFGILFVINMEMGYLTPPFGFNLFILKGVAPPDINMAKIYRSIVPFVILQALCLGLVMVFPEIATWLPNLMK